MPACSVPHWQYAHTCVFAGIYVNDILDAVPIDKYFELFKPAGGGEGGFIRIGLDFVQDASQLASKRKLELVHVACTVACTQTNYDSDALNTHH